MSTSEFTNSGTSQYKRRVRNYLLDVGLQLRYTLAIVVVSAILTAGLGYMIYQATRDTSRVIELTGMVDPVTAELMQEEFATKDQKVIWGIVGFGAVLALSVFAAGILITHKIAGPLYNIARIFRRVRDNILAPPLRQLRKGDELQDFYRKFQEMHEAIRYRADEDIRILGQTIEVFEAQAAQSEQAKTALEDLRKLHKSKVTSLDPAGA